MIIIMIISGLLSIMSVWSDKPSNVRISLNDIFMVSLMIGWMVLFMGIYYKNINYIIIGILIVIFVFYSIRKQLFITEKQYIKGMIPHHSMAILMSKRLKDKNISNKELEDLVNKIILDQEAEINILKKLEKI